ncbi:hypothetical protein JF544_17940 [Halobacillus kuroshimensis]|uniref:Uncharacterized protein n=2 Tax=Halobacillus kuroshimensis TaxID=302481 RepID=A0ABS3E0K6_9BACI|nr:hypothetical protein [Halobacillus kuroshimensis]
MRRTPDITTDEISFYPPLKHLDICSERTLEAWYKDFDTGDPNYFYKWMETLNKQIQLK